MADFREIEQRYGLPEGYLYRTRQIESGGGVNTYNPRSQAKGDFQFIPKTAQAYGLANPYDTALAADAAARLARDNMAALRRAGIAEPTAAQLYLAHQQGAAGATKLLNSGQTPASALVGGNAVAWNGGSADATGPAFAQQIMAKYNGVGAPSRGEPPAPTVAQPAAPVFGADIGTSARRFGNWLAPDMVDAPTPLTPEQATQQATEQQQMTAQMGQLAAAQKSLSALAMMGKPQMDETAMPMQSAAFRPQQFRPIPKMRGLL